MTLPGYRIGGCIHRSRTRSLHLAEREADGLSVVIKTLDAEYPAMQELAGLRREFHVIERLQGVAGVIRAHALVPHGHGNVALVLEAFGASLAERIATAAASDPATRRMADFFAIAIAVAETLGRVHELDVVHKNIEPRSILVAAQGEVRLIDFRIASELSLERQSDAATRQLEGALPYISPEQTGRMNRDLDYRSDHYSLGVTLYELLTGALPFQAASALEWVHSHISKAAPSPSDLDSSIPRAVSAIVQKLLAKNAEDRYQSSYGLVADLRRCQRELAHSGAVQPFALGHRDVSRQFHIPQRLYGREPELATLMALFERVASGSTEFCMVSGSSGVGKSALINELSKPLVRRHGWLIQGKFDQFQRSTPYAAVAVALRSLVQQRLAESDEQRRALRAALQAALGANGRVLVAWLPELEALVGASPEVPELPRAEAQNRFQLAFLAFVRVIAHEQPLVIFLDDLQFSDASTLNLIRWLADARDLERLLFIGAYRSNEVDLGHPLRLALNEIEQSRAVHELPLRPLALDSVEQLVADTLHVERAAGRPLAELLHDKAQGNPFYLSEMLRTLEQERAISFSPDAGSWRWDMTAVRHSGLSSNVVDLVVANLRKLSPATQATLQLAACIGYTYDLRTLSIICERSMDETSDELLPALQRHMVVPLHDDYRLVGQASGAVAPERLPDADASGGPNPSYRFQHDRVQQAAYALIDDARKQAVHLSVGRLIQRHAGPEEREARLIDIVGHLNEGRRLITDAAERQQLARLNLAAGTHAQRSSAYEAALGYLRIGQELLPPDPWRADPELTMALASEVQQCAYLTARRDEAEAWIEQMLAHAPTRLAKAEILAMRTRQYATIGKMVESIEAAVMGLALLGIRISSDPGDGALRREQAAVRRNLAGRPIAELIDAPPLADPAQKVAIRLLMEIFPAAFLSGSGKLFPFLVLKSVNISLAGGNSPESAFAYAAYGMLLCGVLDDPALGHDYGQLAVAMNDRFDDIGLKSRVVYLYTMFVRHWSHHWASMTPWFRRGIESGYQSGDLLYLAYSAQDCIIWDPTLDLEVAEQEHANYLNIVRDCKYQDSLDSGTLFLQMQRNFLGRTDGLCSMNDAGFDEARCVQGMRERRFMTGVANYHIYKAEICCFYGRHAEALIHVRAQDELIASAMSLPQLVRFNVVAFLTLVACLPGMAAEEQLATAKRLREHARRMARWAVHCAVNFLHLQRLMEAELASLGGRRDAALRLYDAAIAAAHASGFRRDEAMANELAGRHLLRCGAAKSAVGYLSAARQLYERWGARRKVEQLEQEFAAWLRLPPSRGGAAGTAPLDSATLDLSSVMKASQAISGELVLDQLWSTTMRIMLENAGGQRGCFVVQRDAQLVIEGLCEVGGEPLDAGAHGMGTPTDAPTDALAAAVAAAAAAALPIAIVYHVLHTRTPVVLHDASRAGPFARDAYLQAHKPQSVLCIPLRRQGKFEGAIYMENRLAAGVFTEDRIEVLKLLAAQVSISIENAELYQSQLRLIAAQRRFVPRQFLESLAHQDIARVDLGEHVAKTMGVMFADLRGFTPLAERLDPRTVIALLNRYFASMEPAITEAGGFIDSYAGDELKGLFEGQADAAVRAGIAMWRALEQLNERSLALGQPELQMGIGATFGPVVLGTVGGRDRIQCSVIGDTVNLASRIEQLTKVYRARFLIGDSLWRSLPDRHAFATRLVDRVAVKGKNIAVEIHEVIDAEAPARRTAKLATRDRLAQAMRAYHDRDFAAALAGFEVVAAIDPDDAVPTLFIQRARRHLEEPLAVTDWQGFERLTDK